MRQERINVSASLDTKEKIAIKVRQITLICTVFNHTRKQVQECYFMFQKGLNRGSIGLFGRAEDDVSGSILDMIHALLQNADA